MKWNYPHMRIIFPFALAVALLAPAAWPQKPTPPAPPTSNPPSAPPGRSPNSPPTPSNMPSGQPTGDLILFLHGRVTTDDGSPIPYDVVIERLCNSNVRQQVYAMTGGDFTMELGSRNDSYVDATASGSPQFGQANKTTGTGIPRLELTNCELRASVSGFRSDLMNLVNLDPIGGAVNVGAIMMHRTTKTKGMTVNVALFFAATRV